MILDLLGVFDDGTTSREAPVDPRKTLSIPLGIDAKFRLSIFTTSGTPLNMAASSPGATIVLTVKKTTQDTVPAFYKSGVSVPVDGINRVNFTITPQDTRSITPGRYVYDVWITYNGARNCVIPTSPFVILPTVTSPP